MKPNDIKKALAKNKILIGETTLEYRIGEVQGDKVKVFHPQDEAMVTAKIVSADEISCLPINNIYTIFHDKELIFYGTLQQFNENVLKDKDSPLHAESDLMNCYANSAFIIFKQIL